MHKSSYIEVVCNSYQLDDDDNTKTNDTTIK